MARLGRRERHEKRERFWAEKARVATVKETARADNQLKSLLPRREYNLLTSGRAKSELMGLSRSNLKGHCHTQNLYIGRSMGSGKKAFKAMPDRFLQGFMAPGHELVSKQAEEACKEKRQFSERKVGYVTKNGRKTKRVIWKEVGKP